MTVTGVAALIAAVSFAVLACCGVYLTMRLNRVVDDAATLVREAHADQQVLLTRANAAVDRASAQLDRADGEPEAPADHFTTSPGSACRRAPRRSPTACHTP